MRLNDQQKVNSSLSEHSIDENQNDVTTMSQLDAKRANARRRIEMLKEIQESGLSLEEARELGLLD